MSSDIPNNEQFDVFLCHNTEDKPEIRQIADELSLRGLRPWLDEREIPPGKSWQEILETQIETIKAAAVFVGKSGLGPWQNMEMRAFINEFVERACPVIPVILPSATETPKLPILLKSLQWVDFRKTGSDPFKQMIWGINGEKPDHQNPNNLPVSDPVVPCKADEKDLLPTKAKQIIELRLPGNVEEFSPEQQMTLMQSLTALLKIGEVKVTRVVAGSIRLYLEADQADADKLYSASKEGRLDELSISEARLYPAIAMPPDQEQRAQLLILLDRVQEYWVDGVLKQSLHHEVLIALGKQAMDEAVEPPWKQVVALPDERRHLLLRDRNINTVFDATGLLLILGEPGSGKTTTLLELAAALIVRAKSDPKERVPIVLNLSSWKKLQPLDEWMVAELSTKYRIPMPIARAWLGKDYLVPLLDGLDEVQTALQPDCVAAINEFIDNNKPSGLVVCCRLAEYQWLPERLRLNGAICLEPLSLQDVNKFLTAGGAQLAGLQQALKSDPALQELAESPLMLSIMSLACEGVSGEALSTHKHDSPRLRREQIFRLYVDRMFERKEPSASVFPKDKIIGWLSWLARTMKERSRSVFMVEELQPSWLSSRAKSRAVLALCGVGIGGVIGGMISWVTGVAQLFVLGLFIGLWMGGVYPDLWDEIHLVETMRWQAKRFWERAILGLIVGVCFGLLEELSCSLTGIGYDGSPNCDDRWKHWLGLGLLYLLVGLPAAILHGLSDTGISNKVSPNQGITLSLKNALIVLLITGLTIGLMGGLLGWLVNDLSGWLMGGLVFGLLGGLIGGLHRGGSSVAKHYALRLILWLTGATPFRFIPFLDHCAKLILLKKVGGGYMFIHRTLLEYFAALHPPDATVKKVLPDSVP